MPPKRAGSIPPSVPVERDLLDLDADAGPPPEDREFARIQTGAAALAPETWREPVGAVRRLKAAFIDVTFIGAINSALVWLTLQVCGLTIGDVWKLPALPLSGFLLALDAGYLLMFTATGGQTVGKMMAHIRVVGTTAADILTDRVSPGQAALRALLTLPSVMVLGLGFLPALVGEGRAVHDRLAHTRRPRMKRLAVFIATSGAPAISRSRRARSARRWASSSSS